MNAYTLAPDISGIVADQAERLFAALATRALLQAADAGAWSSAAWQQMAEAGLPLALTPESRGGAGLPATEGFQLAQRAAWHALPLPLGESLLARALWCAATASSDEPVDADAPWTLADTVPGAVPVLRQADGGFVLHGQLARVPWATQAERVLAWAQDEAGIGHLVLLPTPSGQAPSHRNLANEPLADLTLDGLWLERAWVHRMPTQANPHGLRPHGALLRAHQMVGAMERCLESALGHATERTQFGRTISHFPAVQNLLVEATCETAAAEASLVGVTARWSAGNETDAGAFALALATAKARTGEAAGRVAALCHQVHGAMGFTQEHTLHHLTRRLWAWRDDFGNETFWQREIGRAICLAGGNALWLMVADDTPGVAA